MLKQFLEAGKVVGMHGVRGEMRFDVWCDGADFLKKIKTLYLDADGRGQSALFRCALIKMQPC